MDDNTSIDKHLKDSTFSKPLVLGQMVPTCSLIAFSYSLSSLLKIHVNQLQFSAILQKKNNSQNELAID